MHTKKMPPTLVVIMASLISEVRRTFKNKYFTKKLKISLKLTRREQSCWEWVTKKQEQTCKRLWHFLYSVVKFAPTRSISKWCKTAQLHQAIVELSDVKAQSGSFIYWVVGASEGLSGYQCHKYTKDLIWRGIKMHWIRNSIITEITSAFRGLSSRVFFSISVHKNKLIRTWISQILARETRQRSLCFKEPLTIERNYFSRHTGNIRKTKQKLPFLLVFRVCWKCVWR